MLIPMVVSAVIGAIWGLLGYWYVSDTNMAHGAGAGPAASPLIGLAIGAWSIRVRRANFTRRALMALLNLYLAVGLFSVFVAAWHVTVGWYLLPWPLQSGGRLWAFLKAISTTLLMFTLGGYVLLLWPVSLVSHMLVWTRVGTGTRRNHWLTGAP
jgi:hypothetical protein